MYVNICIYILYIIYIHIYTYYIYIIYGVSARIYKDKTVKSCFCLERIVYIKFSKNGSLIKLYHMSNILDFLCESIIVNKIVNIVIFFYISWKYLSLWNYLFIHHLFRLNFSTNVSSVTFLPITPLLL